MGFGAVAGHLILLVAVFSAGVLVAGAINNNLSSQVDARDELADRLRDSARADYNLTSDGYASGTDRTFANFTNTGSREVNITDVTLLVDGTVIEHDQVHTFEIRDHADSDVWAPGDVLEVTTDGRGDANVTIADPYGLAAHRRP